MTLTHKHELAILLHTAAQWHSDREGGINLLSLSSIRKVLSEEHRKGLIAEIKADILYCLYHSNHSGGIGEMRLLIDLLEHVTKADIGHEWLTDKENLNLNEELYVNGVI